MSSPGPARPGSMIGTSRSISSSSPTSTAVQQPQAQSQAVQLDSRLQALIVRVQNAGPNDSSLINVLDGIRAAAKGDDNIKTAIGEHLISHLVRLISQHSQDVDTALTAAKLLRSITVSKKNKERLQPFCRHIIKIVPVATLQLQIPLAAVLWNMSSIPINRDVLIREGVLSVLATLLSLPNGQEVQTEAAGATRNFTLDERYLAEFAKTNMIETLVNLLPTTQSRSLLACLLVALRNLSTNIDNQAKLASTQAISAFGFVLRQPSPAPLQDQKYVLETLANLSYHPPYQLQIARARLDDVLISMASSKIDQLAKPANHILRAIAQFPQESNAKTQIAEVLHSNDLMEQSTEEGYITKLMEKLHIDENPIQPRDVFLKKQIGEGAYGSVYLAEYHGYPVACKIIKAGLNRANAERLLDELRVMRKLKHPNVVLLMGACLNDEKQIMILTEFVSRGDLKHCLEDIASISKRMRICLDVAQGLNWLGSHKIVHRDLKLDNLLVTEDYSVKITDFGLSIQNDDGQIFDRFGGNVKYSAPEILHERFVSKTHAYAYGEQTDVYSFGLIWWQVLTKQDPFRKRPPQYKGKEGLVQYILEDKRPALPKRWPKSLCDCITSCWSANPQIRPTFRQILDQWEMLNLDLLCPDPLGQVICKAIWAEDQKKKVNCETVLRVFKQVAVPAAYINPKDESQLEELLRDSAFDDTVSFDRFCYVISWFGPLDAATNSNSFFRVMNDTLSQECFHGFLTNQKSDSLLTGALQSQSAQAYYLVKYSFDSMGEFILTFITSDGKINYVKVRNIGGQWQIGTSPKQYDNWYMIQQVCKQVIGIGTHLQRQK